jgi:ubiquinone/menaquinone biosynthesis C-methylase UbiE
VIGSFFAIMLALTLDHPLPAQSLTSNSPARYEFRSEHDSSGIGKFYLGREIAHVMTHEGADWLERTSREAEEGSRQLVAALGLKPGDVVADLGCGTGYYTRPLARTVGTNGLVYAVDIQPEMLQILTNKLAAEGLPNVRAVLGSATDPNLPRDALDLILMVDVYHEFDQPFEMMATMIPALKPEGRIAIVEFRGEDPALAIKRLHKMTEAQVKKEMAVHPLQWQSTYTNLPRQHLLFFTRRPNGTLLGPAREQRVNSRP